MSKLFKKSTEIIQSHLLSLLLDHAIQALLLQMQKAMAQMINEALAPLTILTSLAERDVTRIRRWLQWLMCCAKWLRLTDNCASSKFKLLISSNAGFFTCDWHKNFGVFTAIIVSWSFYHFIDSWKYFWSSEISLYVMLTLTWATVFLFHAFVVAVFDKT